MLGHYNNPVAMKAQFVGLLEDSLKLLRMDYVYRDGQHGLSILYGLQMALKRVICPIDIDKSHSIKSANIPKIGVPSARRPTKSFSYF
jgi:hypothetical protein